MPASSIPSLVSGSRLPLLERGDVTPEGACWMQAAYRLQKSGIMIVTVNLFFTSFNDLQERNRRLDPSCVFCEHLKN